MSASRAISHQVKRVSSMSHEKASLPFGNRIALRDGHSIPQLGFGVYEMSGRQCKDAVRHALESGYRSIDSAEWYGNEQETGEAILEFLAKESLDRSDIFYTSKLRRNSSYDQAQKAIRNSVKACGLGYIDLYLLHSPYPDAHSRSESWRACEEAVDAGLVRSIGVSNFGTRHLQELMTHELPVINQIDIHPFMTRNADVAFCEKHGIKVEAWGPLARGERMDDPTLLAIAKKYGKSVAQCMLRWSLQRGFICIPKSVNPVRMKENRDVFDFRLSDKDMEIMTQLDEYFVTDWDPIGDVHV